MRPKSKVAPEFTGRMAGAVLLTVLTCLTAGKARSTETSRTVRDWTVRCTDVMCQATTGIHAGGGTLRATMERDGKPGSALSIGITRDPPDPSDTTLILSITGTDRAALSLTSADGRFYPLRMVPSDDPLIAALKDGKSLAVSTTAAGSKPEDTLSLSGVTAAFLFMDEFQDRLDRTDALVRVGTRPLPASPSVSAGAQAPDSVEIEYAALPARFRRIAVEKADCDPETGQGPAKTAWRVDLPDGLILWEMSCWYGAYNFGSAYYLSPAGDPDAGDLVEFASPSGASGDTYNPFSLTNAFWDPKLQELTSWHKSRGVGDCGVFERHRYRAGIFSLHEYREKPCDGVWTEPPDYPLIYKARD